MTTLRTVLQEAEFRKTAVGHFNISDLVTLKAIDETARELKVPVLVGVSEGERAFMGVRQVAALVRSLRDDDASPVFLNADHTHSLEKAEEAANAGFDEILFDGSALTFEENVDQTRRAVEAIKSINPSILVEGEIGFIGSASEILDEVPKSVHKLTTPAEAQQFIEATGIDVLSPAVGNMHGLLHSMVRGESEKRLNIGTISDIKGATGCFMTLHGASGTNGEDLKSAIQAGITIVHFNTEIRLARRRGLEAALVKERDTVAPYKILPGALEAVKQIVRFRLQMLNSAG